MKAMKIEVLVLDFEGAGEQEVIHCLETGKYINVTVMKVLEAEVEWSDDHPLNKSGTQERAYQDLFPE